MGGVIGEKVGMTRDGPEDGTPLRAQTQLQNPQVIRTTTMQKYSLESVRQIRMD